ncbi:hypothetical protein ACFTSF_38770 [Kribbella sp. NPDC056951]|uniref:Uncharacterized protein n=1 Tax=Kribbella yunnanensis TaxID=190194 RepID=A0ABN2JBG0_9ACTN
MKTAYLVYLGWTLFGILAVIALGVHADRHPAPNEMFGNPVSFAVLALSPGILLGWLAGLVLVALFRHLHPVLDGSLAYGGALLVAIGVSVIQMEVLA